MVSDVMYLVPDFVEQGTVLRCGTDQVAANEREVHARIAVLKKIKDFEKAVENKMPYLGQRLAPSLKYLDDREPDAWAKITLRQVAQGVLNNSSPPPTSLICLHKWLMSHPEKYMADPTNYLQSQTFAVRPVREQRDIEFAVRAIHRNDPCVADFVEKAKRLIAASRSRKDSLSEPATAVPDKSVSFTDSDRIFLRFLSHSLHSSRTLQKNPFLVPTSAIIKRTGMYTEDRIEIALIHRMLQEMGALPPWDDILQRDVQSIMSLQPATKDLPIPRQKLGPDQFYSRDMVEHLRHDFGNLRVYVVDDYGAEELGVLGNQTFVDADDFLC